MPVNIVEIVAAGEGADCSFDQRCRFGHRVEAHAVYCHNDNWDDSPRKCRCSWYTNGETKDEDCPGFEANPEFKGELCPTPLTAPLCEKCEGAKLVMTDRGRKETCPLCMGSGSQPVAISLTPYEQDTLEIGLHGGGRHSYPFVRIAETADERKSIQKLDGLGLIHLRSISLVAQDLFVYLLENTMKGEAVMRANWKVKNDR